MTDPAMTSVQSIVQNLLLETGASRVMLPADFTSGQDFAKSRAEP
jgi:hypothetical protein